MRARSQDDRPKSSFAKPDECRIDCARSSVESARAEKSIRTPNRSWRSVARKSGNRSKNKKKQILTPTVTIVHGPEHTALRRLCACRVHPQRCASVCVRCVVVPVAEGWNATWKHPFDAHRLDVWKLSLFPPEGKLSNGSLVGCVGEPACARSSERDTISFSEVLVDFPGPSPFPPKLPPTRPCRRSTAGLGKKNILLAAAQKRIVI